ncbi:MAG: ADP-ribosylation factor-directed GTPase activating protein isoform b [Planctomycetota bacterium]|nr:ADP-ribosylation factor-directed GTPase activating protein isoform b [Planctomycetota bacterium]MDA1178559.1 ADP-ribosylation factor-directed GTPase activating protein isoform b [Planctomycetota bacterium]
MYFSRRSIVSLLSALAVATVGCGRWSSTPQANLPAGLVEATDVSQVEPSTGLTADEVATLRNELDDLLEKIRARELNTTDHAAWQVLHGVLAYGRDFPLTVAAGKTTPALDYLLQDGTLKGWQWQPGTTLPNGRTGLRGILDPGTKTGQGHVDQWFAYLSQAGLSADQTIVVRGQQFTMADMIQQSQLDVPRNVDREFSWTVAGLASYVPTNATWTASDGQTWSFDKLLDSEVQQDLASSACGGTHRMVSLTMALNQHASQGGEITGSWAKVDEKIRACISRVKEYQQKNGAFSSNYFERPGVSADLAQMLGSTGHTFEFVALAVPDSEIRSAWVARAARYLSGILRNTIDRQLECGALYHATHGLVIYRQRLDALNPPPEKPAKAAPTATAGPVSRSTSS